VLCSGGLDSAVLLAHELARGPVQPIYVSVGLAWEATERRWLARLLEAPLFNGRVQVPAYLEFSMRDLYSPAHWAVRGAPPAYDTPDTEVYLAGRNVVLLAKVGVFCAERAISRIALGPLAGNPFPDATPAFFAAMSRALSLGLGQPLTIEAPFAHLHKTDVVRLGTKLGVPLELTRSCMSPGPQGHCGRCSKCRERHEAFVAAGLPDPTIYATPPPR
jgi:7-cyano-7-deazaguanine synthase